MLDHYAGRRLAGRARQSPDVASATIRRQLAAAAALPCRSDPELFFAEKPADVERARALCGDCPVRADCLAGALQRGEPFGVWGGQLLLHGTVIPYKRPRGRPRRAAVAA